MPFTANTMPAAFVKKNHQEPESCQSGLQSLRARHNDGKAVGLDWIGFTFGHGVSTALRTVLWHLSGLGAVASNRM